jgi:hypothetical protein
MKNTGSMTRPRSAGSSMTSSEARATKKQKQAYGTISLHSGKEMLDFPVYIISKSRFNCRPTADSFEEMGVDYYMVIEASQKRDYCIGGNYPHCEYLILPQKYLDEYDVVADQTVDTEPKSTPGYVIGPGAARNFCWDHSANKGHKWHWVFDDNLQGFYRYNNNRKIKMACAGGLQAVADWVRRYTNIAIAGLQYEMFCPRNKAVPPVLLNTRIYSNQLIKNSIPFRWRSRYNDDTDLCLRIMKAGWCTALFYPFLANKIQTMMTKGGNTDALYKIDGGRLKMAQSLQQQHPDVVSVTRKFSRWQHHVDYRPF